jgi:hypothetical protein
VSYAKLKAQVAAKSYEWDVTVIEQGELRRAEKEGLIEPIDWRIVQKDKLFPGADFANGIGACALGTNLVYRSDQYPRGGPKNWADFWDVEKFPGPRAMINNPVRALVFALAADGVPADKIFPLDVERAFRKLDQVKKHIKVWWTQGNQSQQLLRDGEVHLMAMWNARASELKAQGVPVEGGVGRRHHPHDHVVRGQRGAQPRSRLAVHPIRRAGEAAGGILQSAVLWPHQSGGVQIRQPCDREGDADPSAKPQGGGAAGRRVVRRQRRQGPGALHTVGCGLSPHGLLLRHNQRESTCLRVASAPPRGCSTAGHRPRTVGGCGPT